jgi:conjugal transfer mating pair stabilization protein TraG
MLRNDLTGAQVRSEPWKDAAILRETGLRAIERGNVATEQAWRSGSNAGQRQAASMLGLPLDEASRKIGFINTLAGEARSSAVSQLAQHRA